MSSSHIHLSLSAKNFCGRTTFLSHDVNMDTVKASVCLCVSVRQQCGLQEQKSAPSLLTTALTCVIAMVPTSCTQAVTATKLPQTKPKTQQKNPISPSDPTEPCGPAGLRARTGPQLTKGRLQQLVSRLYKCSNLAMYL